MMTCGECQARLDDWLDGEVEPIEAARLADHLGSCTECRRLFGRAEQLQKSLGSLARAADAMAAPSRESRIPRQWPALTRIAAVLVFGAVIVLAARVAWTPRSTPRTPEPRITSAQPRDAKRDFEIETRPQTIVCAESTPSMAVHFKSKNPKVQIVWFYQPYGAEAAKPATDPTSSPADDTKGTRV